VWRSIASHVRRGTRAPVVRGPNHRHFDCAASTADYEHVHDHVNVHVDVDVIVDVVVIGFFLTAWTRYDGLWVFTDFRSPPASMPGLEGGCVVEQAYAITSWIGLPKSISSRFWPGT
jgi:hypothetical protein